MLSFVLLAVLAAIRPAPADSEPKYLEGLRYLEVEVSSPGRRPFLKLEGPSLADPGDRYSVALRIDRIPCQGRYSYFARGEDRRFDANTEFEAILRLDRYRTIPPGLPCGQELPAIAGTHGGEVVLANEISTPFRLAVGQRRPGRRFPAELTLNGVVQCTLPYRFRATLVSGRGRREYRYRATFLRARSSVNGRPEEVEGCPMLHPAR
jgi:hypothetical protein